MKILKRNQLIVLVISLMLITAGYLNFTANQENTYTSAIASRDNETIGDAQLVSTIPDKDEDIMIENLLTGESNSDEIEENTEENKTPTSSAIDVNTNVQSEKAEDYYFISSKLDRNTMYSELLETYQEMYNNTNATAEAKSEALQKINNINNTKNAIMISENLIFAKGFKDAVVFVNEDSVSVIIKADELKQEEVAQIQNIVSRELNVEAGKIHISNK